MITPLSDPTCGGPEGDFASLIMCNSLSGNFFRISSSQDIDYCFKFNFLTGKDNLLSGIFKVMC